MTRADNTRYLVQAAARRHQADTPKASDAIEHLDRTGQPVTFSAVAAAAGVSRAWLYRNPGIRDLITRLRTEPAPAREHPGRPAGHRRILPRPPGRRPRRRSPACEPRTPPSASRQPATSASSARNDRRA